MAPPSFLVSAVAKQRPQILITTTFLISNLHCPTCVTTVASALASLRPRPWSISSSILSHSVTVTHAVSLSVLSITKALEDAAFEVDSVVQDNQITADVEKGHGTKTRAEVPRRWPYIRRAIAEEAERKRKRHVEQCAQCQSERTAKNEKQAASLLSDGTEEKHASRRSPPGTDAVIGLDSSPTATGIPSVVVDSLASAPDLFQASLAIGGMTCSSCVGTISDALCRRDWVHSVNVNLLTNSATVSFEGKMHLSDIVEAVEDLGYEASVENVEDIKVPSKVPSPSTTDIWRATFAIVGMTCSSCVGTITKAVQQQDWVQTVQVNLISNSAMVVFRGKEHLTSISQAIENVGYEAILDDVASVSEFRESKSQRKISIHVAGMYCSHCPSRISDALSKAFGQQVQVEKLPTTSDPILRIDYVPHVPNFTVRQIVASIAAADVAFQPSIYHPPSLEQRSQEMRNGEQRRILLRLALSIVAAIPTFIIGIVLMTLVDAGNSSRRFITEPLWAGRVSRAEWALFIMATPVYFFAADIFHIRALKELRAMWRPKSTTPLLNRFYRFGSMSLLISLGTTIAYFSSIAELAIAATQSPNTASMMANSSYFDSVVFLTMFLLIGRFLEAYSKAKTGDAVTLLGKLRPTEAILVDPISSPLSTQSQSQSLGPRISKISVDLLEVGDAVRVLYGGSPPSDGIVVEGESQFDESSLTGESRLVRKQIGDQVFAGAVNKATPISVQISNVSGTSMLDQIVRAVRDGQARRAPIERVADVITSHFVPFVVLLGVSTWVTWLALGLSGSLPASYGGTDVGGWPLWSLQFSIAVFVVACPCGIGLAAPTALFVGGGLAAQNGILVKGGGEAFQEASALDYIVFDKTGTLTEGGEPSVTGYKCLSVDEEKKLLGLVRGLEEGSSHPVAKALLSFCNTKAAESIDIDHITEIPGKGMQGIFKAGSHGEEKVRAILGNEALMSDFNIEMDHDVNKTMDTWKSEGKSIALLATTLPFTPQALNGETAKELTRWRLSAAFAVSDQLRPEAVAMISALKSRGIEVWMISGDNPATAKAVGKMVGIAEENVIAGVLPHQKAEKIENLQKTSIGKGRRGSARRATVAMVGDGVNDAPALTMADVGIAVGSGSDIAISSAEFVLMSSNLTSILVLIDLSRIVFRRVRLNFAWALVYNLIALPVAAGVLYPVKSNGTHIRLDPVWASLAMALSSVSVVCSSLLLRSKLPGVGFRPAQVVQKA